MAKNYGVPLVKNFFGGAASEILKLLAGPIKPKGAFRSVAKTSIRQHVGAGLSGTFRKLYTSNTLSHRRFGRPKLIKKRTIRKVTAKSYRKRSCCQKKRLGRDGP